MAGHATVAAKKHTAVTRGKLHHITITPSDNGGAIVEARFRNATPEGVADGPYTPYEEREAALTHTTTHENAKKALKMVGEHLGVKKPVEDKDEDGE